MRLEAVVNGLEEPHRIPIERVQALTPSCHLTFSKSPVTPLQVAFAYVPPLDRRHQVHLLVRPQRAATKCRVKHRRKQTHQRCLTHKRRQPMPAHPPPSGLRVELEDAQLLVAAAGLRDARGPCDGLLARGQF